MYGLWSASKTAEIKSDILKDDPEKELAYRSSLDRKPKCPKIV